MSRYDGRLPMNYREAARLIERGCDVKNTKLRQDDLSIAVLYRGHVIARFYPDGRASFTVAGHPTWSTHQRLNAMTRPRSLHFSTEGRAGMALAFLADDPEFPPTRDMVPSSGTTFHVAPDGTVTTSKED